VTNSIHRRAACKTFALTALSGTISKTTITITVIAAAPE
jgi:hypothetical protein